MMKKGGFVFYRGMVENKKCEVSSVKGIYVLGVVGVSFYPRGRGEGYVRGYYVGTPTTPRHAGG